MKQTDAETAASPEWQAVKEDLRQHYIDVDAMPEAAGALATSDASIYSNLVRNSGMGLSELPAFCTNSEVRLTRIALTSKSWPCAGCRQASGKYEDKCFDRALGNEIADGITQPTTAAAVKSALWAWTRHTAAGTADLGLQTIVDRVGQDYADQKGFGGTASDLFSADFGHRLGKTLINAAVTLGTVNAATGAIGLPLDMYRGPKAEQTSSFFANFSEALKTQEGMKLPENAPGLHNDAMQTVLSGQLRMSRQAFNDYWMGQSMDPAVMAEKLGVTFSVDAVTGREYAEVPTANYFGKLATKDQKGLAFHVIDPASKLTLGQYQALQQWAASGGPAKLQAQLAQTDPETAATSEGQTAIEALPPQDAEVGRTPEDADTSAATSANVFSNPAGKTGMEPSELLKAYGRRRGWIDTGFVDFPDYEQWENRMTIEQNALNGGHFVISGDPQNGPAVVINPHAYAYLRQLNAGFGGDHWAGIYLEPPDLRILKDHVNLNAGRISAGAKSYGESLVKALGDNRSARDGTILMRDGLDDWEGPVTLIEERMHDFDHAHPIPDDWLHDNKVAADKARAILKPFYPDSQVPREISAKLMAGDKFGLSVSDAKLLRNAYLDILRREWGSTIEDELPDLGEWEKRLDDPR